MPPLDLIRQRRSQRRDFRSEPVRRGDIDALIEAARWAPSPFNIQPWELLFITEPAQKAALGELTRRHMSAQMKRRPFLEAAASWTRVTQEEWQEEGDGVYLGDQLPDSGFARLVAPLLLKRPGAAAALAKLGAGSGPGNAAKRAFAEAPLLCVVFRRLDRVSPGANGDVWTLLSIGAMFQNMLLEAEERGIGAQFAVAALETAKGRDETRLLLEAPETCEPILILRMGYLKKETEPILSTRLPAERIAHFNRHGQKKP